MPITNPGTPRPERAPRVEIEPRVACVALALLALVGACAGEPAAPGGDAGLDAGVDARDAGGDGGTSPRDAAPDAPFEPPSDGGGPRDAGTDGGAVPIDGGAATPSVRGGILPLEPVTGGPALRIFDQALEHRATSCAGSVCVTGGIAP